MAERRGPIESQIFALGRLSSVAWLQLKRERLSDDPLIAAATTTNDDDDDDPGLNAVVLGGSSPRRKSCLGRPWQSARGHLIRLFVHDGAHLLGRHDASCSSR